MKYISKFFASIIIVTMVLTACGGTSIISTPENVNEKTTAKSRISNGKEMKIAIVSSPNGVDDGNFNEDIYKGVMEFVKKNPGAEVTPIRELSCDIDSSAEMVADIVEDYDVIVCCGFQFTKIGAIAPNFPKKKFILVDGYPTNEVRREVVCNNIYAMTFKDQESGFLAGMAAAFESKTKKVAAVTGIPYPSNVNYQYGFESGVNYVNERYDMEVEIVKLSHYAGIDVRGINVGGNYIGSFDDKAKGKTIGKELLAEGCDVIFVAAGEAGVGVFDAVKENVKAKELMVIGCDTDQFNYGKNGKNNIVLTSVLKIMHTNVEKQLDNIISGKFEGENALLGADSDSTGYVKEKGRNQLLSYTIEKLDEAYALIKSGEIVPAANFNDMTPRDFKGLKKLTLKK